MNEDAAARAASELDLTDEPPVAAEGADPIEREYDPEPEREQVRARIAQGLTLAVILIALGTFAFLAADILSADDMEPLQLFFTPLITLTGTALGFYFGGQQGR